MVKIGRYGPLVQIGSADDKDKPRFAQLPKDKSLETITLEEALELFRLPRTIGKHGGANVTIGAGRFGPYVLYKKKYVSIPKDIDPLSITLEQAVDLLEDSKKAEQKRHLRKFEEDAKLEIMNGRYGPYLAYDGKNYRLPKAMHDKVNSMTYDECMAIINKSKD
jgi:DNA topoisomerase-1